MCGVYIALLLDTRKLLRPKSGTRTSFRHKSSKTWLRASHYEGPLNTLSNFFKKKTLIFMVLGLLTMIRV